MRMKRMSRALKMVTGPKTYGVGLRAIPYTWNRIQSSGSVCHSPVTACGRPYVIYLSSSHSLRALEIKVNHFCFALLCFLSFVLILCLEDSGTRLSDVAHLWSSTSFIHSFIIIIIIIPWLSLSRAISVHRCVSFLSDRFSIPFRRVGSPVLPPYRNRMTRASYVTWSYIYIYI